MEELKQIEKYASLLLTIEQISILVNLDDSEFRREIRGKRSDRAKAYWRGKLTTIVALREQTLEFALAGSPQSETVARELLTEQESDE